MMRCTSNCIYLIYCLVINAFTSNFMSNVLSNPIHTKSHKYRAKIVFCRDICKILPFSQLHFQNIWIKKPAYFWLWKALKWVSHGKTLCFFDSVFLLCWASFWNYLNVWACHPLVFTVHNVGALFSGNREKDDISIYTVL